TLAGQRRGRTEEAKAEGVPSAFFFSLLPTTRRSLAAGELPRPEGRWTRGASCQATGSRTTYQSGRTREWSEGQAGERGLPQTALSAMTAQEGGPNRPALSPEELRPWTWFPAASCGTLTN